MVAWSRRAMLWSPSGSEPCASTAGMASRVSEMPGVNSRLDELHAAMLAGAARVSWTTDNARRVQIAAQLRCCCLPTRICSCLPAVAEPIRFFINTWSLHPHRDQLRAALWRKVLVRRFIMRSPRTNNLVTADSIVGPGGLPHTERAAAQVLSLPMFPQLTDDQVARVGTALAALTAQRVAELPVSADSARRSSMR